MPRVIFVSREQLESAQALVRISGALDKVKPIIAKIATAPLATPERRRLAPRG